MIKEGPLGPSYVVMLMIMMLKEWRRDSKQAGGR